MPFPTIDTKDIPLFDSIIQVIHNFISQAVISHFTTVNMVDVSNLRNRKERKAPTRFSPEPFQLAKVSKKKTVKTEPKANKVIKKPALKTSAAAKKKAADKKKEAADTKKKADDKKAADKKERADASDARLKARNAKKEAAVKKPAPKKPAPKKSAPKKPAPKKTPSPGPSNGSVAPSTPSGAPRPSTSKTPTKTPSKTPSPRPSTGKTPSPKGKGKGKGKALTPVSKSPSSILSSPGAYPTGVTKSGKKKSKGLRTKVTSASV